MKINLGTDLCFAVKRWPNPDEWIDIVKNELGLKMVEFDSDFLDPLYNRKSYREIAQEIRNLTRKNGIAIHNYFSGDMTHSINFLTHPDPRLKKDAFDWCIGAIDIASIIGARGIGANFNNIPFCSRNDTGKYTTVFKSLLADILALSDLSGEKGLEFLLWEQMYAPSEVPYRIQQAKGFLNYINKKSQVPVKLVIDLGHMCSYEFRHTDRDVDPYNWLASLKDHLGIVHLQQTNRHKSQHWPFTEYYNDKGIIDPGKVLATLCQSGLKEVDLIFEIFFPINLKDEVVLSEMRESVEKWKNEITGMGFTLS